MKNLFLFFLLFSLLSCHSATSTKIASTENQDVHVILLAGQSNMAGAANYDALDDKLKKRIEKAAQTVQLSVDGNAPKPLSPKYSDYQQNKRGFGNVFGPELFLGLTLAEKNPQQQYLFIKKAQGGTALEGAWNPEWTAEKAAAVEKEGFKRDLQLYKTHQQQIKQQLALLEKAGKSYKIVGMFWMQGENDAAKEVAAKNYEANLKKLIAGYRSEFNVPDMPFIMGQINSSYGKFKKYGPEMVRNAMLNVAKADKKVAVIETSMDRSWSDFPKHTDNVHYNHVGQMRLGIAFSEEFYEVLGYK